MPQLVLDAVGDRLGVGGHRRRGAAQRRRRSSRQPLGGQRERRGLRYLIVPVRAGALARARIASPRFGDVLRGLGAQFAYVLDAAAVEGRHWNNDGVLEDVATGSAAGCVAGYLLRKQGYDVVGVTMKVWPQDCTSRAEDKCCGPQAVADARSVAHSLGIPHYVVDEADQFERLVIDYFSSEYQAGRTPNPCVMCNEKLKFGNLWNKAQALGCAYIATGHYAIIEHHADRARQ